MPLTDTAKILQTSARLYGKHISPGETVTRVVIIGTNGRIAALKVPPQDAAGGEPILGWDFANTIPHFGGKAVPVHGIRVGLLRTLAESPEPMTVSAIREAWPSDAEDVTIRWHIAKLRATLTRHFKGEGGIALAGGAYTLFPR